MFLGVLQQATFDTPLFLCVVYKVQLSLSVLPVCPIYSSLHPWHLITYKRFDVLQLNGLFTLKGISRYLSLNSVPSLI